MNVFFALTLGILSMASPIRDDERVIFYPTYATYNQATSTWMLKVHVVAFEPEEGDLRRQAMVEMIHRVVQLKPEEASSEIFKERIRPFLYDNERGKELAVEVWGRRFRLPETGINGHSKALIQLKQKEQKPPKEFLLRAAARDGRVFTGDVQAISKTGLSIISDIDDTIKISQVVDQEELIKNTFFRPFRAVPGLAKVYREAAEKGAAFHYVSGSPWQLYEPLAKFLLKADFPRGSFSLRTFRLKDKTAGALFESPDKHKLVAIRQLMKDFPQRQFLLIGDSGERDPEIYCQIAKEYPDQVVGIFIRSVTDRSTDATRYAKLLRTKDDKNKDSKSKNTKLRPEIFHVFENAEELHKAMKPLLLEKPIALVR